MTMLTEEQARYKELAERRGRELDQIRADTSRAEREQRITRIAAKACFINPDDAFDRISPEDGEHDVLIESALARMAEQSPHVIAKEAVPGAPLADGKPAPPPGKAPLQSLDEYEALSQAERIGRMDEADWLFVSETAATEPKSAPVSLQSVEQREALGQVEQLNRMDELDQLLAEGK